MVISEKNLEHKQARRLRGACFEESGLSRLLSQDIYSMLRTQVSCAGEAVGSEID